MKIGGKTYEEAASADVPGWAEHSAALLWHPSTGQLALSGTPATFPCLYCHCSHHSSSQQRSTRFESTPENGVESGQTLPSVFSVVKMKPHLTTAASTTTAVNSTATITNLIVHAETNGIGG